VSFGRLSLGVCRHFSISLSLLCELKHLDMWCFTNFFFILILVFFSGLVSLLQTLSPNKILEITPEKDLLINRIIYNLGKREISKVLIRLRGVPKVLWLLKFNHSDSSIFPFFFFDNIIIPWAWYYNGIGGDINSPDLEVVRQLVQVISS